MALSFKKLLQNPAVIAAFKKAAGEAGAGTPAKATKGPGLSGLGRIMRGEAQARPEKPASGSRMGAGIREVAQKVRDMGNKKTVAESTVESATKMKKGGMADKSGRAMKRRTADTKGRAMRKGK